MNTNTVWHNATITRAHRERLNVHRSAVLWFTGLSGSGKSTLAHAVEEKLYQLGCRTFVLDGDNVRQGLCSDLGFSVEDRSENIRRISEAARLLVESGVIAMTAFISPFRADRQKARSIFPHGDFIEIFCEASLAVCEQRDVKGLYKRARTGEVKEFTGISSPYEAPATPELIVRTGELELEDCVAQVIEFMERRDIFKRKPQLRGSASHHNAKDLSHLSIDVVKE
ncbi:adenylyl-sulfate kinase [Nitrosospira multiformis]|jgi:adenylylsulfate kinase|uniref:Adenylyl-sulfate kinase n=1 Tax=Nitrosospira multiformis (strain ATCC 25196 / NCIMB 11849 / C 71) TaxID=323848 RepID=Q2YCB4_NITMU|nr:adenylyl-sulfate kinase [Nitrosospira multiformis]ABB73607.1 adenylylsulfate kinase [Nitrosospira multiformis ATCC 25196]SDZ76986.1 adenylylsulfate kinase [Nitrosospira multiformis]SEF38910.1 adenylylsulfate kinase [Nitrosospira multiformis ATCC 25196]